jgi:tetratricopeptide (TPR) repeat protein
MDGSVGTLHVARNWASCIGCRQTTLASNLTKRSVTLAATLLGCSIAYAQSETEDVLSTTGIVGQIRQDLDPITFDLFHRDPLFVLDSADPTERAAIRDVLQDANKTYRGILVRYTLEGASLSVDRSHPTFQILSVDYQGRRLPISRARSQQSTDLKVSSLSAAERTWVRGAGLAIGGRERESISEFNQALSDTTLASSLQALGHKLRGQALVGSVKSETRVSTDAGDRDLVRALEDFRAWQAFEPDSAAPLYEIGQTLRDLGAYPEALRIYAEIAHSWPEEFYWSAIRSGDTQRELGSHQLELEALDELVKQHGQQSGMAFHYHRGGALMDVGRPSEAIAEISEGLKEQPDYAWAFIRRSCAESQVGRFADALRDQQSGIVLLKELDDGSKASQFNLQHGFEVEALLRTATAENEPVPIPSVCYGYWSDDQKGRRRSSQLPAHLAWMPVRRDPIRAFLNSERLPILSGVLLIVMVLGLKSWWARIARG